MGPTKVPYGHIILKKNDIFASRKSMLTYSFWWQIHNSSGGFRAIRDLCRALVPIGRPKEGSPRGHIRCELWVLIGDFSLYTKLKLYYHPDYNEV